MGLRPTRRTVETLGHRNTAPSGGAFGGTRRLPLQTPRVGGLRLLSLATVPLELHGSSRDWLLGRPRSFMPSLGWLLCKRPLYLFQHSPLFLDLLLKQLTAKLFLFQLPVLF